MRFIVFFFVVILVGCGRDLPTSEGNSRELVILARIGTATYSADSPNSLSGFEYDLVQKFAEEQGVTIRIKVAEDDKDLLDRLAHNEAHIAIAWASPIDEPDIRSSLPYFGSHDIIATHEATLPASNQKLLKDKTIHVIAGSRQEMALQDLQQTKQRLKIVPVRNSNDMDLLESVATRRIEAALVSDAAFSIGTNFYPELQESQTVGDEKPIVWWFAPGTSNELIAKANEFIARIKKNGELDRLVDRYFGHVDRLSENDVAIFIERMRSVLPQYRPHFQEAQIRTGIDWRLLAALAYQESRWTPLATSPTGVRGMMMLTEDTADRLGVGNRLDPVQSISAGAQYLSELRDTLPAHIREPDRTWLALAAYNLGMGHLNAARHLAKTQGSDPDSWYAMKKILPLLAKPQYYRRLKSGKGRGGEAVILTENIRVFADILNRFERPYEPLKLKSDKFIWKSFQARPDTGATLAAP